MEKPLETAHTLHEAIRRRGNEYGSARTASADPVLRSAKFAGSLFRAASAVQEPSVNFADQSQRDRELVFLDAAEAILHCVHVIGNFTDIFDRNLGFFGVLK